MVFIFVLVLLAAGFTLSRVHPVHYHKLHQYEGQFLYLKSAELGFACVATAVVLTWLVYLFAPEPWFDTAGYLLASVWEFQEDGQPPGNVMALAHVAVLTMPAVWVLKAFGHVRLFQRFGQWRAPQHIMLELVENTPFKRFLVEAIFAGDDYLVMLTMRDRKLYIGSIVSIGGSTETVGPHHDLVIKPLVSGYRKESNLRACFTTKYDPESDIELHLKQNDIASATHFTQQRHEAIRNIEQEDDS